MTVSKAIFLFLSGLILLGNSYAEDQISLVPYAAFTQNPESGGGLTVWLWRYGNKFVGVGKMCESCDCVESAHELSTVEINEKTKMVLLQGTLNGIPMSFQGSISPRKDNLQGAFNFSEIKDDRVELKSCCKKGPIFSEFKSIEAWRSSWQLSTPEEQ